jgi:hypothetical protein
MEMYPTFQDGEFGAGVDLSHTVGGSTLIDGLVPVGPQGLDTQDRP